MEAEPQANKTEPTPRTGFAIVVFIIAAMMILLAFRGQRQCGCVPLRGTCPLPTTQVEQTSVPGGAESHEPQSNDVNNQQSSETFRKEFSQ
jgi:hypothetical protein